MDNFYNLKNKKFSNGESAVIIHNNHKISINNTGCYHGVRGESKRKTQNINRSLRRTKETIYDLSKDNEWEYFITLTFNPKKVNSRYDYNELLKKTSIWLKNIKQKKSPNLKYIIVPDLHRLDSTGNRAFHFHGLISDIGDLKLIDTGKKDTSNNAIYNIKGFTSGFTTATKINDTKKASAYITKYMVKELAVLTFNKKRYLCSTGLNRPELSHSLISDEEMAKIKLLLNQSSNYRKTVDKIIQLKDNDQFILSTSYYYFNWFYLIRIIN